MEQIIEEINAKQRDELIRQLDDIIEKVRMKTDKYSVIMSKELAELLSRNPLEAYRELDFDNGMVSSYDSRIEVQITDDIPEGTVRLVAEADAFKDFIKEYRIRKETD